MVRPPSNRLLVTCSVACCLAFPAGGAEYYVDVEAGSDDNEGTINSPWQHLSNAARKLQPGDTVYLRAGRYEDDSLFTYTDGTAEAPVTICAYPGETPILTGQGIWGQVIHLNNDYHVVSGLVFEDTDCYNVLFINQSSHNVVRDCQFRRQTSTMILIRGGGYHTIERCSFDTTGSLEGPGAGDHIYIAGSHHNLVQGNHFVRAGHAACDQIDWDGEGAHHNILRRNLIEQHWGGGLYVVRDSHRSLIEDNRIYYVGEEMEYPKAPVQLAGNDNIVRRNVMASTGARPHSHNGIAISAYRFGGIDQHAIGNMIYANVLYRIGRTAIMLTQRQACRNTGNQVLNNIVYRGRVGGPEEPYWPNGNYYLVFETYHASADSKWAAFPNDNAFHHNLILHAGDDGDHPGEDPLVYYEQEGWGHSLAWVQETFPAHFHSNVEENPRFVDAEGGDFHLRDDSPAIDRGDFLTRTVADGTDTRAVPVESASSFCDGWDRVEGDLIQVGESPPVRLASVDYAANVLALKGTVSFPEGAPVSLPWHGSALDVGAFESGQD